jgi:hypothetical protein
VCKERKEEVTLEDDDETTWWKDPKVLFFLFGSTMLLMFLLGIWFDDGRFAWTGLVMIAPTFVAGIGWAYRDMV